MIVPMVCALRMLVAMLVVTVLMLVAVCLLVTMLAFVLVFVFLCHFLSPSFYFCLDRRVCRAGAAKDPPRAKLSYKTLSLQGVSIGTDS